MAMQMIRITFHQLGLEARAMVSLCTSSPSAGLQ